VDGRLTDWARPHYRDRGGRPFLFYVVYGSFHAEPRIDAQQYRTSGIYSGLNLASYSRKKHGDAFPAFEEGYLWDMLLLQNPVLARQISDSDQCLVLRGEIDDQADLNYLRDSIGLLTYFFDHGGICIYDPQMFRWWEPEAWRRYIFEPCSPVPRHHVVILTSEDDVLEGQTKHLMWFHTRGMRKFGRPDLSVHNVPPNYHDAVIDMIGRFIEHQGFGSVIKEGQEIRMKSLPSGTTCHHQGDLDDPEFNNVHVEITLPVR
jgi:hypothetical protein